MKVVKYLKDNIFGIVVKKYDDFRLKDLKYILKEILEIEVEY